MKKIVVLLLCLVMVVSVIGITACSNNETPKPSTSADNTGDENNGGDAPAGGTLPTVAASGKVSGYGRIEQVCEIFSIFAGTKVVQRMFFVVKYSPDKDRLPVLAALRRNAPPRK